jgi:sulfite oxidase
MLGSSSRLAARLHMRAHCPALTLPLTHSLVPLPLVPALPRHSHSLTHSPPSPHSHTRAPSSLWKLLLGAASALACSLTLHSLSHSDSEEAAPQDAPGVTAHLPVYTREQVAKHTDVAHGVWTTFGNGVYDITGFIENHPGGSDKVVLAAGGRLENYWNLYRQHYASPTPREHLARMCIGRVHPDDLRADLKSHRDLEDPFSMDPDLSPVLRCFVKKPVNAEPPGPLLTHSFLTPNDIFFIRNHHPVPQKLAEEGYKIDEAKYILKVEIAGNKDGSRPPREVSVSLADLKSKFPCHEVVASIQCGGNRREELSAIEQTAGE